MSDAFLAFTADSAQQHNPGGASWIIKVNTEHFMKPWPSSGDIQNGVIVNMPLLRADAPLARINPVAGTLFYRDALIGRYGHQFYRHELGYEIANDTQEINLELEKDVNSTAVFIVGKSDGTMRVLGKSSAGLQINNDSDSGVEGGENKTTVKAISNVQTRKKLVLSSTLETQILSGNDGYGLARRIDTGFPFLLGQNGGTVVTSTFNLIGVDGLAAGRRFAVNDQIRLLRVASVVVGKSIILRPESEGFATARITAVANTAGLPAGLFNNITIGDQTAFNVTAGSFGILTPTGTTATMTGDFLIQKL
jgi:hypothetical protein